MTIIVSKAHQSLVVPPKLAGLFSGAPVLPEDGSVVPHDLRSVLLLRHMGVEVPNPMLEYYSWEGGTPFDIQRKTCRMLTENPRAYVLNEMGTGKTKTVLWAWDYMNKQGFAKKLLVVCKRSNLYFTWAAEAFATLPNRKCIVLYGSKSQRLKLLAEDADIYVINHDGMDVIGKELWARSDIDTLCLDELAVYRNNSERSKKMRKFAKRFPVVWGLTGSPMPHEPVDVWGQAKIITPATVPEYRTRCKEMLMDRNSQYVWTPKPNALELAHAMMKPSVRFSLDEVMELPQITYRDYQVALSSEQRDKYEEVRRAMASMIKEKVITAANAGVAMNKLLQIAGGWVYTNNKETVRLDPTPRIIALADLIDEAEHKVIVAVPYRHMIEGISKIFSMKGVGIDHCVVHGGTTGRDEIFSDFQNTNKYKVMVCHPQTVSHGLTLTAASIAIWYLPVTSWEIYEQFNARIRRVGQAHKQQIINLVGSKIEMRVYSILRKCEAMQDRFLDMVEEATR